MLRPSGGKHYCYQHLKDVSLMMNFFVKLQLIDYMELIWGIERNLFFAILGSEGSDTFLGIIIIRKAELEY